MNSPAQLVVHPSTKNKLKNSKSIGVISLLENKASGIYIGTLVFQNKYVAYSFDDWKMDDFVKSIIKTAFEKSQRYEYINLDYNIDDLLVGYEPVSTFKDFFVRDSLFGFNLVEKYLKEISKKHPIDILIVVARQESGAPPRVLRGYGVSQESSFGMKDTFAYANIEVRIFDTDTFEVLAKTAAAALIETIPDSYWKDKTEDFSMSENNFLEKTIKKLIYAQIMKVLVQLNIIQPGIESLSSLWTQAALRRATDTK